MIQLNNNISIKQVIKVINNDTGEEQFLMMNDNKNEWVEITQADYNKIRGQQNEQYINYRRRTN